MLKILLEFGPFVAFLLTYKYSNIFMGAIIMLCTTLGCLAISYFVDKKVSNVLLLSGALLLLMTLTTIFTGDTKYFKMKPTIAYLAFAGVLAVGLVKGKIFVREVFSEVLQLEDQYWAVITKRFIWFFILLAITNEVVWRNFSEDFWVNFKVFGAIPLSMLFMMAQIPFLKRHSNLAGIYNKTNNQEDGIQQDFQDTREVKPDEIDPLDKDKQ